MYRRDEASLLPPPAQLPDGQYNTTLDNKIAEIK
jgi:hypothetical protein